MTKSTKKPKISATEPDWSREECRRWWDPSRQLLKTIRNYRKWQEKESFLKPFFKGYYVLQYRFWSVVTGAEIPLDIDQIAGGLILRDILPTLILRIKCGLLHPVSETSLF